MRIDDATAAFAAWLRPLPAHLVISICSSVVPWSVVTRRGLFQHIDT